jgi:hypothetical protein
MNETEARVASTAFVWLSFTVIAVTAMVRDLNIDNFMGAFLAFMLVIAAISSTKYIWRGVRRDDAAEEAEKTKRSGRVDRMLERLNERELDELRSRLINDSDGEAVSLEDVLQARRR